MQLIRREDGTGTLFYCDPPYLHETRTAQQTYGEFEMSEENHRELLDLLRSVRGKVMLSGCSSRLYDDGLAGCNRHTFDLPNNAAGGYKKGPGDRSALVQLLTRGRGCYVPPDGR
jgi:DNA adenine methylase